MPIPVPVLDMASAISMTKKKKIKKEKKQKQKENLARIAAADGHDAAVDVQLAHDGRAAEQLRPEGLRRALAQPQQADQYVLVGILVRQERLPAAVGHVVAPDQLHLLGGYVCLLSHL